MQQQRQSEGKTNEEILKWYKSFIENFDKKLQTCKSQLD
jgi:hypothetical protein